MKKIKAALWAGLITGAVFLALEMFMVPAFAGGSPWGPPRMIAAIILGKGVLPPPATFDLGIFVSALVVHLILSIAYVLLLAWIIDRWDMGRALLAGLVFGLILYLVNFYPLTIVFPWFVMARNWITIFTHLVFGVVGAWAYKSLQSKRLKTRRS